MLLGLVHIGYRLEIQTTPGFNLSIFSLSDQNTGLFEFTLLRSEGNNT